MMWEGEYSLLCMMLLTVATIFNRMGQAKDALRSTFSLYEMDTSATVRGVVLFAAVSILIHEVYQKMGQMLRNRATSSYVCNLFSDQEQKCTRV